MPIRSTAIQLVEVIDEWTAVVDERREVEVKFPDFRKTFDTMPQQRFLRILNYVRFSGNTLK